MSNNAVWHVEHVNIRALRFFNSFVWNPGKRLYC